MKRKQRCKVCNTRFDVFKEDVYQVTEQMNVVQAFTAMPKTFDVVDCPGCGCQRVLQERLTRIGESEESNEQGKTD